MTQFDLHLGDCVAGMAHLEAASVDLVVTSPPYNLGIRYGKYADTADRASYLDWCERWAAEVRRLLRPNGSLFLNLEATQSDQMFAARVDDPVAPKISFLRNKIQLDQGDHNFK